MKKKLKDFTEEEIAQICDNNYCADCPFSNQEKGYACLVDYLNKEIWVPDK